MEKLAISQMTTLRCPQMMKLSPFGEIRFPKNHRVMIFGKMNHSQPVRLRVCSSPETYHAKESEPGTFEGLSDSFPKGNALARAITMAAGYILLFGLAVPTANLLAPSLGISECQTQIMKSMGYIALTWFLFFGKNFLMSKVIAGRVDVNPIWFDVDTFLSLFALYGLSLCLCNIWELTLKSIFGTGGILGLVGVVGEKYLLANIIAGIDLRTSQPFSIGDCIKAGSMEGEVRYMGILYTIVSKGGVSIRVSNRHFSSENLVNYAQTEYRKVETTLHLNRDCLGKIQGIAEDIKSILQSLSLKKGAPYCYLLSVGEKYAVLEVGCCLLIKTEEEYKTAQHNIVSMASNIIQNSGGFAN